MVLGFVAIIVAEAVIVVVVAAVPVVAIAVEVVVAVISGHGIVAVIPAGVEATVLVVIGFVFFEGLGLDHNWVTLGQLVPLVGFLVVADAAVAAVAAPSPPLLLVKGKIVQPPVGLVLLHMAVVLGAGKIVRPAVPACAVPAVVVAFAVAVVVAVVLAFAMAVVMAFAMAVVVAFAMAVVVAVAVAEVTAVVTAAEIFVSVRMAVVIRMAVTVITVVLAGVAVIVGFAVIVVTVVLVMFLAVFGEVTWTADLDFGQTVGLVLIRVSTIEAVTVVPGAGGRGRHNGRSQEGEDGNDLGSVHFLKKGKVAIDWG